MYKSWEEIITKRFPLGKLSSKGWHQLKCPVCGDKKVRAGFKFENKGWGYNCFRGKCNHRVMWNGPQNSDDARGAITKLFRSGGIRDGEWEHLLYESDDGSLFIPEKPVVTELKDPKEIKLPTGARPLSAMKVTNTKFGWAVDWLVDRGVIDENDQSALDKLYMTLVAPKKNELNFRDRIIIPYYFHGKLVFYQGVWVNPNYKTKIKYLNTNLTERDNIFYNMDELERETDEPLFIVEGVMDAWWFKNTVSILSNTMTDEQLERLRLCRRRKIFIPDHDRAGTKMAEQAAEEGWEVSFPEWGSPKDLDKAVRRYGKVRTLKAIMENIYADKEDILHYAGQFCVN